MTNLPSVAQTFRQYETDNVPSSGPHKPDRGEIRETLGALEARFVDPITYDDDHTLITGEEGFELRFAAAGTVTLSLFAASTGWDGFYVNVHHVGVGGVIIDPAGSDTIEGDANLTLQVGEAGMLRLDDRATGVWSFIRLPRTLISYGLLANDATDIFWGEDYPAVEVIFTDPYPTAAGGIRGRFSNDGATFDATRINYTFEQLDQTGVSTDGGDDDTVDILFTDTVSLSTPGAYLVINVNCPEPGNYTTGIWQSTWYNNATNREAGRSGTFSYGDAALGMQVRPSGTTWGGGRYRVYSRGPRRLPIVSHAVPLNLLRLNENMFLLRLQIDNADDGDYAEWLIRNYGPLQSPAQTKLYAQARIRASQLTATGRKFYPLSNTDPDLSGDGSVFEFAVPVQPVGGPGAVDPRYGSFGHGRLTYTGALVTFDGARVDDVMEPGDTVRGHECNFVTETIIRLPNDNTTQIGSCAWTLAFNADDHLIMDQVHTFDSGYEHTAGYYTQMMPTTNTSGTGIDRIKSGTSSEYSVVGGGVVTSYTPSGTIVARHSSVHPFQLHMIPDASTEMIHIIDNDAAGSVPANCKVYADRNESGELAAVNRTFQSKCKVVKP